MFQNPIQLVLEEFKFEFVIKSLIIVLSKIRQAGIWRHVGRHRIKLAVNLINSSVNCDFTFLSTGVSVRC